MGQSQRSELQALVEMTQRLRSELKELVEKARMIEMSPQEHVEQRRSFAYGNAAFENPSITKKMIEEEEAKLGAALD